MIWIGAQTNKHTLGLCLNNHLRSFLLSKDKWCWPDREYIGTRLSDLACLCLNFDHFLDDCPCWTWATNTDTNMDKHKYKYKYKYKQCPKFDHFLDRSCSSWVRLRVLPFPWTPHGTKSPHGLRLDMSCKPLACCLHPTLPCLFVWPGCEWDLGFLADGRGSDRGRVANAANPHVTPYSLYTPRIPWTCF